MSEEQFYSTLKKEIENQLVIINKAVDTVLNQEVTDYPIVVLHQADVELGVLLLQGGNTYSKWGIRISSLEELVAKKIMRSDRVEDFRKIFKDPEHFFCLLVLQEGGMQFIFMPRTDQ